LKAKVSLALFLFLHLLAHPLVHATDGLLPSQTDQVSRVAAQPANSGFHECAVCHTSSALSITRPIGELVSISASMATLAHVHDRPLHDGIDSQLPSRAPPTR
jgi:hypothetical protein